MKRQGKAGQRQPAGSASSGRLASFLHATFINGTTKEQVVSRLSQAGAFCFFVFFPDLLSKPHSRSQNTQVEHLNPIVLFVCLFFTFYFGRFTILYWRSACDFYLPALVVSHVTDESVVVSNCTKCPPLTVLCDDELWVI